MCPMSRVDGRIFWAALLCRLDNFGRDWAESAETPFWPLHGPILAKFHFEWRFLIAKMIFKLMGVIFLGFGPNRPIRPSDFGLFHVLSDPERGVLQFFYKINLVTIFKKNKSYFMTFLPRRQPLGVIAEKRFSAPRDMVLKLLMSKYTLFLAFS